jgi:hypothetical protein
VSGPLARSGLVVAIPTFTTVRFMKAFFDLTAPPGIDTGHAVDPRGVPGYSRDIRVRAVSSFAKLPKHRASAGKAGGMVDETVGQIGAMGLTRRGVLMSATGCVSLGLIASSRADDGVDEVVKQLIGRCAIESDRIHLTMPRVFLPPSTEPRNESEVYISNGSGIAQHELVARIEALYRKRRVAASPWL